MFVYWIYIYFILVTAISFGMVRYYQKNNSNQVLYTLLICLVIYLIALIGLSQAWYGNQKILEPRWFNDWGEWRWMDKLGHFFTAFTITRFLYKLMKWVDAEGKLAVFISTFLGFCYMGSIEVLDASAAGYGASVFDLLANTMGVLFVPLQLYFFKNIIILPKFSFHATSFAAMRPSILGGTFFEEVLKDYNGQTYWYSFPIFRKKPQWKFIHFSIGIGANNLLGGYTNQWGNYNYTQLTRESNILISLDFDWEYLFRKYKFLSKFAFLMNNFKTPFPTIKFSSDFGIQFFWIYF